METQSITVMAGTALAAFIITAVLGKLLIPVLHKMKFGQTILDIGPAWHKAKQGTPTMGGILFILGMAAALAGAVIISEMFLPVKVIGETAGGINTLVLTRFSGGVIMALCCGAIGFMDDYIKIVKKRNLGLTDKQKLFAQILVAAGYAVSVYMAGGSKVHIPFLGMVDFGWWFIPFCVFVIVAIVNATNLTDGIDGLCGTVSFVAVLFFLVASGYTGYYSQSLVAAAMAGALAGFLVWNLHPAKVFMGDTGSLFIGGVLCAVAFGINRPFLLVPVGLIYIAETVSVMLQVMYFKLTHGKRLFKMAPLHHHFEMSGWSENKIVSVFSMITIIGCFIAGLLLYYV